MMCCTIHSLKNTFRSVIVNTVGLCVIIVFLKVGNYCLAEVT